MAAVHTEEQLHAVAVHTEERTLVAAVHTEDQLLAAADTASVEDIYFHLESYSIEECEAVLKKFCSRRLGGGRDSETGGEAALKGNHKNLFLFLPQICRSLTYRQLKAWIYRKDSIWHDGTLAGCVVCNMEEAALIQECSFMLSRDFFVIGNHNLYCWNRRAKEFWMQRGLGRLCAPLELCSRELSSLGMEDMEIVVYSHLPLMLSAQCLPRNMGSCQRKQRERGIYRFSGKKGREFLDISYCDWCYNVIYDARPYVLYEELSDVTALKPAKLRMDFITESGEETKSVLEYVHLRRQSTKGHFDFGVM